MVDGFFPFFDVISTRQDHSSAASLINSARSSLGGSYGIIDFRLLSSTLCGHFQRRNHAAPAANCRVSVANDGHRGCRGRHWTARDAASRSTASVAAGNRGLQPRRRRRRGLHDIRHTSGAIQSGDGFLRSRGTSSSSDISISINIRVPR